MIKYTEELKIQVVQKYLDGVGGYHYLAEQYNVEVSMIRRWVGWYNAHGIITDLPNNAAIKAVDTKYVTQRQLS